MIEFEVTLYKSINDDKYEEKEWVLMIESVIIYLRSSRFLMMRNNLIFDIVF